MYFLTSRDTLSRSTLLLDSLICRREQNAFRWISRGFRFFNFLWISHRSLKLILNFNFAFIKETYTFASQTRDLRELYGSFSTSAAKYRLFPSVRSGWVDIGQVRESIGKCRARKIPRAANNSKGFGLSCPLGRISTGKVERNPNSLTKTEYTGFWGVLKFRS